MILVFPYIHQPGIEPSPATPSEPVFRPKIPVRIHGPEGHQFLTWALVDTGADDTILPLSAAKPLRVELDSKIHALYGANARPIQVRYGIVELSIANGDSVYTWRAKVGFQHGRRFSVLGHAACLDLFDVCLDGPNRQIRITTH